mgnify:CR=1 FL=1
MVAIGSWNSDAVLPGEVPAKPVHDSRLGAKIEFGQRVAPKLREEGRQIRAPKAARQHRPRDPQPKVERVEIAVEQRLQPRPLHLDRDRRAIRQACLVHLGQGRGGDGFGLEAGKGGFQRRFQLILDDAPHRGEIHLGRTLLQFRKPRDIAFGQNIGAGAEDLAKLDENRPQGEKVLREPIRCTSVAAGRIISPERPDVFRQDGGNPGQPQEVPGAVHGFPPMRPVDQVSTAMRGRRRRRSFSAPANVR